MSDRSELSQQSNQAVSANPAEEKLGRVEAGLKAVLVSDMEVYVDSLGQPSIKLPARDGDNDFRVWLLHSERVLEWMERYIWQQFGFVLQIQELKRIRLILKDKARDNCHANLDLQVALDEDPLLEVLLIFLDEKKSFEGTCTKLLEKLMETAKQKAIGQHSSVFPNDAAVLGRRIRSLTPLLEKAGVRVECGRRSAYQRYVSLVFEGNDTENSQTSPYELSTDEAKVPEVLCASTNGNGSDIPDVFRRITPTKGGNQ